MKLVSVITATYRRDVSLQRALESLAMQSYSNMEIILVDDNGDDQWNSKVAEIVCIFREKYPEITLNYIVNDQNSGSARTRNIGIAAASGSYITFLDDDDIYLKDKIRKQVDFMEEGGYDYCITDLILYNEDGKRIDNRVRFYIKDTSTESLQLYHLMHHMTGTDSMMFKKEYLTRIGSFAPIDVGDEFYLMQRAIEGGGRFGYLPGCEFKAYVHTGENGLSSGECKIKGEKELYNYKKTFYPKIDNWVKRYITMRHHAVLAFAYKRNSNYQQWIKHGMLAVFSAPIACIKLIVRRKI